MSEGVTVKDEVIVYKGYRMLYDLHTHTTFSHGKGSIKDNVEAALKKGLVKIAITDHGPGHLTYGIKRSAIPEMRREIEELKKIYPHIEISLSVEANIVKSGKGLDIKPDEFAQYDFVIGGYHYGVLNGYCIENYLQKHVPHRKGGKLDSRGIRRLRMKNTEMMVRAIYENNLKILTHPGDKGPFDILAIAKACEAQGTLMEISTWHKHLTVEEIKTAALTDVRFIISSDAHVPSRIGDFQGGLDRAIEAGIDLDRIVNIERV
ncbi:PHP domain-containing protein [Clostridium aminobutyricum]|uniref:PHP domain-containing protein n=1 Tax=Clostridium aminobutyricum TaxID=33953 RepID=A0A939IIW1_CLOAM|nr:PHP domain-containing protein [Clostridium aminobutyricum]MBN7772934.1 PHP domain-containing protein [Clostridium aminobutyricum]